MDETSHYISNDTPITFIAQDKLDFSPYVEALAEVIATGDTPLTIGLFGTWGSGKTSLMHMVQE